MSALERMRRALRPLRLYDLDGESLVARELAVYAAALDGAAQTLEETARALFVQTAEGAELARHESLVGLLPRTDMDDDSRRALVLYRLGSAPFDFDRAGMLSSIRAAGMEAEIREDYAGEAITVRCLRIVDQSLELDALKASVRSVLPAHLEAEFDIGELTWDLLEAAAPDWDAWDATDMNWADFDLNGHNIFL